MVVEEIELSFTMFVKESVVVEALESPFSVKPVTTSFATVSPVVSLETTLVDGADTTVL